MILGRPADELAHGHSRPAQTERKGASGGLARGSAQASLAQLGRARPRRCGWALPVSDREQGRRSAGRCSPAASPPGGAGSTSAYATPRRNSWDGGGGPAA